jgi:hypothetical protein
METLKWQALEYEEKDMTSDWFWALGVIIVTGSIASMIYHNYFFATLIVLGGLLLGFFAKKKPEMVSFELNKKGLKIREQLYPYLNIKSFYIQTENKNDEDISSAQPVALKPILFIRTERIFLPIIEIPIENRLAQDIHSIFTENSILEEEMKEHPSQKIMEFLGF